MGILGYFYSLFTNEFLRESSTFKCLYCHLFDVHSIVEYTSVVWSPSYANVSKRFNGNIFRIKVINCKLGTRFQSEITKFYLSIKIVRYSRWFARFFFLNFFFTLSFSYGYFQLQLVLDVSANALEIAKWKSLNVILKRKGAQRRWHAPWLRYAK